MMNSPTRVLAISLPLFAAALGLVSPDAAQAGSRKRVELQFQNNAYDESMRCRLTQVWGPDDHPKTKTVGTYVIRGKSTRPEDERHLPVIKQAWIRPVVRRLSGGYVYPKLSMTCSLDGNSNGHNEATNQLWDHATRSFDEYHLWAGCTYGAPCGVVVER